MSVTYVSSEELFPTIKSKILDVTTTLDIGCGINPQSFAKTKVHICCEPFLQYIEKIMVNTANGSDRTYVILNATWAKAIEIIPAKSVDTVLLVDVIEHLHKEKALELLKQTEKIAKRQLAIFTPLGFMPQKHEDGKDAWGLDGGEWQEHKSGWSPDDFDETWDVYVSKDFHKVNSMLETLETPFGALWAIKNFPELPSVVQLKSKKQKIRKLIDAFNDVFK